MVERKYSEPFWMALRNYEKSLLIVNFFTDLSLYISMTNETGVAEEVEAEAE